jgi:hypothetical protein
MSAKPAKKPAVKASASPKKSSATRKPSGGPGMAGKNVSKAARQPASADKAYNAHKAAVAKTRLEYEAIDRLYQKDPLSRVLTGNVNKYKKDFDKVFKNLEDLKVKDKSFVKSGYKAQFSGNKKK